MGSFQTYSEGWSPSWLTKPYGKKFTGSLGAECDSFVSRDQQGVLARYPSAKYSDVTALPSIAFTRRMQTSSGDDANGTKTRQWLLSAFTKDALTSPTPADPQRPGWYYGGTQNGLLTALINSGFVTTDSTGNVVPPRIYTNRQWVAYTPVTPGTTPGTVTCASTIPHNPNTAPIGRTWLPDAVQHDVTITVTGSGTAGVSGSISVVVDGQSPVTASPIPLLMYAQATNGALQLTFSGEFVSGDVYQPSSPDHRTGGWSRMWLVLPVRGLLTPPLDWGSDAGWKWNKPPTGQSVVPLWGAIDPIVGRSLIGLLRSILSSWTSGTTRVIGVWLAYGETTAIDSIPSTTWSEFDVTVGGQSVPFVQLASETP